MTTTLEQHAAKRKRDEEDEAKTGAGHASLRAHHLASLDVDQTRSTGSATAVSPLHSPSPSSGHAAHHGNGSHATTSRRHGSSKATSRRNIDLVHFGNYDIKTWYHSPYQFDEQEWAALAEAGQSSTSAAASSTSHSARRVRGSVPSIDELEHGQGRSSTPGDGEAAALHTLKPGGALSLATETVPAANGDGRHVDDPAAKSIWICDGCFKYMRTYSGFRAHKRQCTLTRPPGRAVYQRGAHTIWEVDGAQQKLYCQNLSLFGKLFIDHKTIYFDVEPFVFYVLTDATPQFDHVLGYFSKEKVSYDDYNLACIITFPPFQKQGFGTLMIEFSYHLSSRTHVLGTPERPLSDLGLKGYLAYWSSVILRTLALFFDLQQEDIQARLLPSDFASSASVRGRHQAQAIANHAAEAQKRRREECLRIRKVLLGLSPSKDRRGALYGTPLSTVEAHGLSDEAKSAPTRRGPKGWAGEMRRSRASAGASSDPDTSTDGVHNGERVEQDNDAPAHPLLDLDSDTARDNLHLQTTLERLSDATNLRIEDLTLALLECGLLRRRRRPEQSIHAPSEGLSDLEVVITAQSVAETILRLNVKRPVLDPHYALV